MSVLACVVAAIFVVLAAWHVRMAFGSSSSTHAAVPSIDGRPLFVPSRGATLVVALALLGCATLIAATGGLLPRWPSPGALVVLSGLLAAALAARAVGDFRTVGFFKRVRGSRFATLDTWVYAPVCVALAIGVATVAYDAAAR